MIKINEQEYLNCKIKENYQKIQIYKLTSGNNKDIVINKLKEKTIKLNNQLNKLHKKEI